MKFKFFLVLLLLPVIIKAQVRVTPIEFRDSGRESLPWSFPLVTHPDTSVAGKINRYLQRSVLENEAVETSPEKVFAAAKYIWSDTIVNGWLTAIDYKIILNSKRILSVEFDIESMGAYPENYRGYYNFNLEDGEIIRTEDIFFSNGLQQLKKQLISERNKRIREWLVEMRKDYSNDSTFDATWVKETFAECNKEASEGSISIGKNSILFYKEYCFPHVVRPYDTDLDIEMSYNSIKNYLTPAGRKLLFDQ